MNVTRRTLLAFAAIATMAWTTAVQAQEQLPAPPCIQSGTPFQVTYIQQTPGSTDVVTYDVTTHQYKFTPRMTMTLCSIGYTSPTTPPGKYRFKLVDVTGTPVVLMNVVLNAPANFPPAPIGVTSYVAVPPVALTPGRKYVLSRKAMVYTNTSQLIGRLLTNQAGQFPIAAPSITIISSKLFGGGAPAVNQYLPFIDFGTY